VAYRWCDIDAGMARCRDRSDAIKTARRQVRLADTVTKAPVIGDRMRADSSPKARR